MEIDFGFGITPWYLTCICICLQLYLSKLLEDLEDKMEIGFAPPPLPLTTK